MISVQLCGFRSLIISHELAKHRVCRSNDVIAVLFGDHHRGLELDDVAMDTISQHNDLVVQQHPALNLDNNHSIRQN